MRMVFYPLKDITLKGICDAFIVRDYSKLKTELRIMTEEAFLNAKKNIVASGTLFLKIDDVGASLVKELSDLSADLSLDADVFLTLLANASFSGGLALDASVDANVQASVSNIVAEIAISGDIRNAYIVLDLGDVSASISLSGDIGAQKVLESALDSSGFALKASFSPALHVPTMLSHAGISVGGSISGVTRRYRKLGDLAGTTLADLQEWNLGTYFYLEV